MSATANGADAQAYFRSLEELFIELRGAPLLLAPVDWQVAKAWWEAGVPLALVERVLREVFARRAEAGAEGPVTLRYCRRAVDAAWKRQQRLAAPVAESAGEVDLATRLAALAIALPAGLNDREMWSRRIEELAGDLETVERALERLEREILDAYESQLEGGARRELEAARDESREDLRQRLPERDVDRALEGVTRRWLRRHLGLPRLSLFS